MTEDQKRLISSLKGDTAYLALINHLEEEVGGMLGALETAETPAEIMRLTRLWQIAKRLVDRMKILPEALTEVIREETESPRLDTELFPYEEDPFAKYKRPPAAPYQDNC